MKGLNIFPKPINLQPIEDKLEALLTEIYNTPDTAEQRAVIKSCLDDLTSLNRDVENWRKLFGSIFNNF